jgi:hypothetical protein
MTDATDAIPADGIQGGEPGAEVQIPNPDASQAPTGDNPAWSDLQKDLDPISFEKVKPHLSKWDQNVQQRLAKATEPYAPYKDILVDRQPESVKMALQVADMLEKDPVQLYQQLNGWLQTQGLLPNQEQNPELTPDPEADPEEEPPALKQLREEQEQMRSYLQQQEQVRIQQQADKDLDTEIGSLRTAHPELDEADLKEIIRRAAITAQQTGNIPTLEEAWEDYQALTNRILSRPRPGDSAPSLLPTSGGTPANQPQRSLGQLSNSETQDLIAGMLAADKGRS